MPTRVIAIVDQDQEFIASIERLLHTAGYTTRSYTTLDGTYDALSLDRPDALMIGLLFPESRHGLDLVTVLKLRPETRMLPIIISSNDVPFLTECGQRLRERSVPAVWMVAKPIEDAEVLRVLDQALAEAGEPSANTA